MHALAREQLEKGGVVLKCSTLRGYRSLEGPVAIGGKRKRWTMLGFVEMGELRGDEKIVVLDDDDVFWRSHQEKLPESK